MRVQRACAVVTNKIRVWRNAKPTCAPHAYSYIQGRPYVAADRAMEVLDRGTEQYLEALWQEYVARARAVTEHVAKPVTEP